MPAVNFKAIRSFSSEDPLFPATNLLASTGKKWKCEVAGEKSVEVVLELASSSTITAVDIGNEHSAFVEVWVAKNGAPEFQQILQISSFMSPVESRNSDPVNRVRCFGKSALVEQVVESKCKWDLVKIVCTQPFNKQVQYGLSFVKLHSSTDVASKNTKNDAADNALPHPSPLLFGKFKIREDSPDSDSESPQSTFSRWRMSRNGGGDDGKGSTQSTATLSAAAAIRNASNTATLKNHSTQVNRTTITPKRLEHRHKTSTNEPDDDDRDQILTKRNRNRSEQLMYEDEDDKPNEKLDKVILKERERLEREKSEVKKNSEKKRTGNEKPSRDSSPAAVRVKIPKNDKPSGSISNDSDRSDDKIKTKRQSSPTHQVSPSRPVKKMKTKTKERTYKPFNKLLDGVVLVISGIQNPARATIRQQALDMGARYKPDWEASCTHLICAFKNTPKYNQVHGHGKIIIKDWITECHKRKMRIPWRRYALDSDDGEQSESENEICDKSLQPSAETSNPQQRSSESKQSTDHSSSSRSTPSKSSSKAAVVLSDDDMASDNDSIDRYNLNSSKIERNRFVSSGSDTEDEICRVLAKKTTTTETTKTVDIDSSDKANNDDIYNATTEEDDDGSGSQSQSKITAATPLPELFKGKTFYLSQNISSTDEIKLNRYISVYGGAVTLVANKADYILSNKPKETSSDFKGEVVKPLWVFECNELETLLPTKRYNFSN